MLRREPSIDFQTPQAASLDGLDDELVSRHTAGFGSGFGDTAATLEDSAVIFRESVNVNPVVAGAPVVREGEWIGPALGSFR